MSLVNGRKRILLELHMYVASFIRMFALCISSISLIFARALSSRSPGPASHQSTPGSFQPVAGAGQPSIDPSSSPACSSSSPLPRNIFLTHSGVLLPHTCIQSLRQCIYHGRSAQCVSCLSRVSRLPPDAVRLCEIFNDIHVHRNLGNGFHDTGAKNTREEYTTYEQESS